MIYSPELEKKCRQELERICGEKYLNMDIPVFTLSAEEQEDGVLGNHNAEDKSIIVYCQSHDSEKELLKTVRHEVRHVWQYTARKDVYDWWMHEHHDLYLLIFSNKIVAKKWGWICTVEADAEAYSEDFNSQFLPRKDKKLEELTPNPDEVIPEILAYIKNEIGKQKLSYSGRVAYSLLYNMHKSMSDEMDI